jgi:MscS family membrane protein
MKYLSTPLFILIFALTAIPVSGLASTDTINYSPYTVIYNHLYYLQPDTYRPEQSALSFPGNDIQANTDRAIMLKQVLDGKGMYVDINMVPDQPLLDDTLGRQVYVLFDEEPTIYLERQEEGWYYSRTTMANIEHLHQEVYPLGTNIIQQFAKPKWDRKFLGIKAWQWLGLLILLLAAVVVHRILTFVFRLIIPRLARRKFIFTESEVGTVKKAARSFSLFILTRGLILLLPTLLLDPLIAAWFIKVLRIFSTVFFVLFLISVVDLFMIYANKAAEATASPMDDQVVPVVRRILKGVVLVGGVIYILNLLEVNVTALLAGISIGGLALALAAQDTVKNLIGSLVIFVDRPFQIGDWINFEGKDGTVEEVGIRSTRVRTFENSITYVPNGRLMDMTVNNMGVRLYRRFKTNIGITYDTPPHLIEAFIDGIRAMVEYHPFTRTDAFEVHLNSFGDNSLNILVYLWFDVPEWSSELEGKHQVIMGILKLAEKLGVRFAFPTSTLHIEEFPGTKGLTPTYNQDPADIRRRIEEHMDVYKREVARPEDRFMDGGD